jgi:hypothetical protein
MKKMISFSIALLATLAGFTQWQGNNQGNGQGNYGQNSSLIISSFSQKQFSVTIDNYSQYQSNTGYNNSVTINTLNAGNHTLQVYEMKRGIFGQQRQELIYNSSVYLRPGFETTVSINAFGQATVSERQIYNGGTYAGGRGNNGNGNGWGYGHQRQKHRKHGCGNDDRNGRYDD